jgi:hypothetical protein
MAEPAGRRPETPADITAAGLPENCTGRCSRQSCRAFGFDQLGDAVTIKAPTEPLKLIETSSTSPRTVPGVAAAWAMA